MFEGSAARKSAVVDPVWQLYNSIGTFLSDHRLDIDPVNYAFAHRLLSDPKGPLSRAVAAITDGGVRLTARDIISLGSEVHTGPRAADAVESVGKADALVARTQMQVEGFADMVDAIRVETQDFGRDLAASAHAMRGSGDAPLAIGIARLAEQMLERVNSAESRLDDATREASALREQLEEARDDARRDPLTGLPNRRGFFESYAECQAAGTPMCVAICDIDRFKHVNDRFGHSVGDRVLAAIAESLVEGCEAHLVARYGGEEFVILFAGIDAKTAQETLDRVRARVAGKRYRIRENSEPLGAVTFSAGFIEVASGEAAEAAITRADALLYAAKSEGRNRVIGARR
jgi:diguanylate cyclase